LVTNRGKALGRRVEYVLVTVALANPSLKAAAIYNEPGEGGQRRMEDQPLATALTKNEIIRSDRLKGWKCVMPGFVWRVMTGAPNRSLAA
jgi:hypothetical protein